MKQFNISLKTLMWGMGVVFATGTTWAGYNYLNIRVAKMERDIIKIEEGVENHKLIMAKVEPTLEFLVEAIKRIEEDVKYLRRNK